MIDMKWCCFSILLFFKTLQVEGIGNCSDEIVADIRINPKETWSFAFPEKFDNNMSFIPCKWRISAPENYVVELTIDTFTIFGLNDNCSRASLSIFDGYDESKTRQRKICDNMTRLLTLAYTDDRYQFVQLYKSNTDPPDIYFSLSFDAEKENDSPFGYSTRSTAGIVIGVIAGIILLVSMITTIGLCCLAWSDQKKRQRRKAYQAKEFTPVTDSSV